MDQQLEQPALDEFARPVLPRPAAVVRQFRRTKIKIYDVVDGIGRSGMLPRQTNEHKLHVADTVNFNPGRMNWKFGGDFLQAWIYNYYPSGFGGAFYFYNVEGNPGSPRCRSMETC